MKKKLWLKVLLALAVYVLLLQLMVLAESQAEGGSITALPLALWYSLVTMTTVGYGDLYPVTAMGKVIATLFLLLSAGALTALITWGITWVSGTGLPKLKLRQLKGRKVYVFDGCDAPSRTLAARLAEEEPEAVCVFSSSEKRSESNGFSVPLSVPEILKALKSSDVRPTALYLGEEGEAHLAADGIGPEADVCCVTRHVPEELQEGRNYLDPDDLCASLYWQNHPLDGKNGTVLLVGFGALGRKLLEYALENCVFSPVRVTEYHVFGDGTEFLADHACLGEWLSLNASSRTSDSVFFHKEGWNTSEQLVLGADRILFCSDDPEENRTNYDRLMTYFPFEGEVHLYSPYADARLPVFGSDSERYTPRAVLRSEQTRMAREMHETYRRESSYPVPEWEELSSFLRRSNYASAEHLREKVRYLLQSREKEFTTQQLKEAYDRYLSRTAEDPELFRQIEHDRWVRFHAMYNWRYAPVRDNARRRHPMLVPYESLSAEERAKDDYAWSLIGKLSKKQES